MTEPGAIPAPMRKTYKRETAGALLAWLMVMATIGAFHDGVWRVAEFMTLPIFTFAGGAFSLDALAKQIQGRVA